MTFPLKPPPTPRTCAGVRLTRCRASRARQGDAAARRRQPHRAGAPAHCRVPGLREIHRGPPLLGGAGDGAAPVWHLPGLAPPGRVQGVSTASIGATPVSASATAVRRLMHYGQFCNPTRCTSFTCFARPAVRLRFRSRQTQHRWHCPGAPEIAKKGFCCASSARRSSASPPASASHGTGAVPRHQQAGDAGRTQRLQRELPQMLQWAQTAVDIAKQLHAAKTPRSTTALAAFAPT